ncbi:metallophosphoesterase [Donghicola sp. XS_ASV15]|uniref:metallophosphoesterase family protein n=1 Tax=Donghicola sp. XS_ASV15 TaxID=3241295 RepID=UPI003513D056
MKTLYHISDLHFGKDRPELIAPLLKELEKADVVSISGDLTQRARSSQFLAARNFIESIQAPTLVVPGNHDVPLHNPIRRFFTPYRNYKRFVTQDFCPEISSPEMTIMGLNTVAPWHWQQGSIAHRHIRRLCRRLPEAQGLKILVAHHPFEQPPNSSKSMMRGARQALGRLANAGLDMVLTGHLHQWRDDPFVAKDSGRNVIQIHVGTGLSSRLRNERNDFAVIRTDGDQVEITRMSEADGRFKPALTRAYRRSERGWQSADQSG